MKGYGAECWELHFRGSPLMVPTSLFIKSMPIRSYKVLRYALRGTWLCRLPYYTLLSHHIPKVRTQSNVTDNLIDNVSVVVFSLVLAIFYVQMALFLPKVLPFSAGLSSKRRLDEGLNVAQWM